MSETEFLSSAELRQMTGARGIEEQARRLEEDGVPFRRRGRAILVCRVHVRDWIAGTLVARRPGGGINWNAVR